MPHTVDKQSSLVNVVHLKVITFLGGVENGQKKTFLYKISISEGDSSVSCAMSCTLVALVVVLLYLLAVLGYCACCR